ncbi:hypothetical protein FQN50_006257 [Emmonsiellopsis sp. PD_5]|nr:hypothetical protein FQN50_006257 [Emmonsiellopsis sp. PD_5]
MPRPSSRSPSPRREDRRRSRSRSRSPRRRDEQDRDRDRPRRRDGGFRWKEKRRPDDDRRRDEDRGLERGYRERERARSPFREQHRAGDRYRDGDSDRRRPDYRDDRGRDHERPAAVRTDDKREDLDRKEKKKEKKEKKEKAPVAASSEPMIIVNVNDRLGTKAAIPCLASDPIRLFKAQVAARIGREPHEILLKRQGERPFKDQLTLEDYGVSNGVQLDL